MLCRLRTLLQPTANCAARLSRSQFLQPLQSLHFLLARAMSFLSYKDVIDEGDIIIAYQVRVLHVQAVQVSCCWAVILC